MEHEQLSLFPFDKNDVKKGETIKRADEKEEVCIRSEKLLSEIEIMQLPFLGCDFDTVYKSADSGVYASKNSKGSSFDLQ